MKQAKNSLKRAKDT